MEILKATKVTKDFGGVRALHEVCFHINEGEIVGLIGPNGSGKTTLINLVTGIERPSSGTITIYEKTINGLPPHQITRRGIARTFQNIKVFPYVSVLENILIGSHCQIRHNDLAILLQTKAARETEKAITSKALELLRFAGLSSKKSELAKNLSYGEQKRLDIIRAIASEPKLLLLDEPAAGINPQESEQLIDLLVKVFDRGISLLIVDHNMRVIMKICERIIVINYGKKIAEGTPAEVQGNEEVRIAYLGKE